MVTPRIPQITVTVASAPAIHPPRANEVVYAVGEVTTGSSLPLDQIAGPYTDEESALAAVGNEDDRAVQGALLSHFVTELYNQVQPILYILPISAATPTSPTQTEVIAALDQVRALQQEVTIIAAPGLCGGTAANAASSSSTAANAVVTEMQALAAEFECRAIADCPEVGTDQASRVTAAVTWSGNNSNTPNTMKVFNEGDGFPSSGAWISAALYVSETKGRQRGIDHAIVHGVTVLNNQLSHSPVSTIATDESRLIGAYLSVLSRRRGVIEILGDHFQGASASEDVWSLGRVVDHLKHVLEHAGEPYIGVGISDANLQDLADHLTDAGRQLVSAGELRGLDVIPDPERNNAASRQNNTAYFLALAGVYHPIKIISVSVELD